MGVEAKVLVDIEYKLRIQAAHLEELAVHVQ
jgi:hypothetical protein